MAKAYNGKEFTIKSTENKTVWNILYDLMESYLQSKGLETKVFNDKGVSIFECVESDDMVEVSLNLNMNDTITKLYNYSDEEEQPDNPYLFVELTYNVDDLYKLNYEELTFSIAYDEFYCNFDFNGQLDVSEFEQYVLNQLNQ